MKVIFEPLKIGISQSANTAIGLGNFDGLHVGHQNLISKLIEESNMRGLSSVVYTFIKHPENILRKKLITPQISTVKKKIELLKAFKLDYLYLAAFDEKLSRMLPEEFVKNILVDMFNAKLVVVGYNYRFGYKGLGDTELLKNLGQKYNFEVIVIQPVLMENEIISSSLIRESLLNGKIEYANRLLGRPFSIEGIVAKGRNVGESIGFPTANIIPEKYLLIPKSGVYVTQSIVKQKLYRSVTNIGTNPTFNLNTITIETHILDFKEDIYGEVIEVFFHKRVRNEKKFDGVDSLVKQLKEDVSKARNSEINI